VLGSRPVIVTGGVPLTVCGADHVDPASEVYETCALVIAAPKVPFAVQVKFA
jgi:hypothetical protein